MMFLNDETSNSTIINESEALINFAMEPLAPLFEASLEAEISWNNLMEDSVMREMKAIRLEDANLMNEADESTLKKIFTWIKERIAAIGAAFKRTMASLKARTTNVSKFVIKMEYIAKDKNKYDQSITMKMPEYNADFMEHYKLSKESVEGFSQSIIKICQDLDSQARALAGRKDRKNFRKDFYKKFDGGKGGDAYIYNSRKLVPTTLKFNECLSELRNAGTHINNLAAQAYNIHKRLLNGYYKDLKGTDGKEIAKDVKMVDRLISQVYSRGLSACYVRMGLLIKALSKMARKNSDKKKSSK